MLDWDELPGWFKRLIGGLIAFAGAFLLASSYVEVQRGDGTPELAIIDFLIFAAGAILLRRYWDDKTE